jgi:RAB protein geranylgeranyltransferase component A
MLAASTNVQSFTTILLTNLLSSALSKAGLKVLHIDQVAEYGGRDASLSAIDLHHLLLSPPSHMEDITIPVPLSQDVLRESRQYAISLMPSIVPSVGPFINTLVNSNVARYVPFKLLDAVGIYSLDSDGKRKIKAVPGSKEDVFKNKDLGLSQKRKLMKFLLNSSNYEEASLDETQLQRPFLEYLKGKDVGLDAEIADAIAYALSLSTDPKGRLPISALKIA